MLCGCPQKKKVFRRKDLKSERKICATNSLSEDSSVNDSIASLKKDIGDIKKKSDVNGINRSKNH